MQLTPEEQAKTYLVRNLAPLADLYVCDAFAAAHRSEPTLVGLPQVLPSAAGRLFEEELRVLTQVRSQPARPCLFLLGGAKILDGLGMLVYQGMIGFKMWTGKDAPVQVMKNALRKAFGL